MTTGVAIIRIGRRASQVIARARTAIVIGVFSSSLHLETDGGGLVCIGHSRIGNGPLNALADPDDAIQDWSDLGLSNGQDVVISGADIAIVDGPVFTLARTPVWTAPAWPRIASPRARSDICDRIAGLVRERAPHEGLARVLLEEEPRNRMARALFRTARSNIATLRDWLAASRSGERSVNGPAERAALGLVGLGPGLTPSGDDFLCGMLVAMSALGEKTAAGELGRWVMRAPADATTPLSRAFLAAARDGEPTEGLHAVIAGLLDADAAFVEVGLALLAATGSSSGWDMLAGAMAVLACPEPHLRSPAAI